MQDRGIDFKSLSETSRLAVAAAGLAGMEPTPDALALLVMRLIESPQVCSSKFPTCGRLSA